MDSSFLLVFVSVCGTLVTVGALGGSALVAGAYVNERAKRQAAESRAAELESTNAALKTENKHLSFVRGNKLYSRAEQDLGFAASQSVIRLRVARADIDEQLGIIERLLDTKDKRP